MPYTYNELKDIITADIQSKKGKYTGRELYYYSPEIAEEKTILVGGRVKEVRHKQRIYTNYFKQLVTQKIDYLLGKPLTYDTSTLYKQYNMDMDDIMDKLMLNASLDATSWLHLYVDSNTKLQWTIVPDSQIIPIYDQYNKTIIQVLRYYVTAKNIIRVEIWSIDGVEIIDMNEESQTILSIMKPHYSLVHMFNGQIESEEPMSFGFIPFIPLFNNKDNTSDSEDIECLLEVYNSITSGFVDNIDLFQEAVIKLTNFDGTGEELKEILQNMKTNRIVGTPSDSDVEYMKVDIPVEARVVILNILRDAIYTIGRGMDPTRLGDGNITNVVIKARYQQLDFKASDTIKRAKVFYNELIRCLSIYYGITINNDIQFNKSLLANENELIQECVSSVGMVSQETILANHPWVNSVSEELKRLAKDKQTTNITK